MQENDYGIEAIDLSDPKYRRILIIGAVSEANPELIENYKKLNDLIKGRSDDYTLLIHNPLATMHFQGTDKEKYVRAMNILNESEAIIAEMSNVSTGAGMELQEAIHLELPILVIAKTGSKISSLVKGCPNVKDILFYDDIYDISNDINDFIEESLKNEKRNK